MAVKPFQDTKDALTKSEKSHVCMQSCLVPIRHCAAAKQRHVGLQLDRRAEALSWCGAPGSHMPFSGEGLQLHLRGSHSRQQSPVRRWL